MRKTVLLCLMALFCSTTMWGQYMGDFCVADDEGNDIYYHITDANSLNVETTWTGFNSFLYSPSTYNTKHVTIPETVEYNGNTYTVTAIGYYTFYQSEVEEVDIPETIITIGNNAFYGATIKEIEIPNSVTEISNYGFYKCESLETIVLGNGVSTLNQYCFQYCTSLKSVTSKNATPPFLWGNVFQYSSVDTSTLYVPTQSVDVYKASQYWSNFGSVEGTGYTFSVLTADATDITPYSATLNGVVCVDEDTKVLEQGFEYWTDRSNVQKVSAENGEDFNVSAEITGLSENTQYTFHAYATIESGTVYGEDVSFTTKRNGFEVDNIFYNIVSEDNEVEVTYADGYGSIGSPNYVGNIVIPELVTYENTPYKVVGVGYEGFMRSTLTKITLPSSIRYIGQWAFYNCSNLAEIELSEGLDSLGYQAFYSSGLKSIELPSTITKIESSCFERCSSLESINIPSGVTTLMAETFARCSELKEVTLAEGLDSIGYQAFYQCSALADLTIPSSVRVIGQEAFAPSGLTNLTLSEGLVTICEDAFNGCTKLLTVNLPSSLTSIGERAFSSCSAMIKIHVPEKITRIEDSTFLGCYSAVEVTLPEQLEYIGGGAFWACEAVLSITIPESVTYIGENAFNRCISLTEISIPGSVASIPENIFYECESLKQVVLCDGVTTIDDYAFYQCTGMESISLPETITSIGNWAFYYCINLKEITIPSQVTEIMTGTFQQCTSLTDIHLHDGITRIRSMAFYQCTCLPEITIPNSVTAFGTQVFYQCYDLKKVIVGKNVKYFDSNDFYYCTSLSEMYCLSEAPPLLYSTNVFSGTTTSNCTLYVPANSVSAYSLDPIWKGFKIQAITPTTIETLEAIDVTETSVTLNGSVTPGTLPVEERGFEYWADATDIQSIAVDTEEDGEISFTLSDLMCGTTYTYRAFAITAGGAEYGEELTFSTELYEPSVETLRATDVSYTSAVLNGSIEQGSEEITAKGFVYWLAESNSETAIIIDGEDMTYTLYGLEPLTTYNYRAFAVTASGTTYGEDVEFTTEDIPTGISGVSAYGIDNDNVESIFSTSGQQLNSMQRGVNIIHLKDGTVKKIYVK